MPIRWEWQLIKQWAGNASKNTENFTITSQQWGIQWWSLPGQYGGGHFSIWICDARTNEKIDLVINRTEPGQDTTYFRTQGNFYLEISGDDHPWQIQVYEYRPVVVTPTASSATSASPTAGVSLQKQDDNEDPNKKVYTTPDTKQYHAVICRHLTKGSKPMTLGQALKAGYKPCDVCLSPPLGVVYAPPSTGPTAFSVRGRASIQRPSSQQQFSGSCPHGGVHTPGTVDQKGKTHCAKCGQYM